MLRNSTKITVVLVVGLALVLAVWSADAFARQGRGHGHGPGLGPALDNPDVLAELGITAEQADQLKEIQRAMRQEIAPIKAEIEVAEVDLEKLMDAASPDRKAIENKLHQIADLKVKIHMLHIDAKLKADELVGKDVMDKLKGMGPGRDGKQRGQRHGNRGHGNGAAGR